MTERAVVICPEAPYPLRGGGQLRTASLLEYLRRLYRLDLITFREAGAPDPARSMPAGLAERLCVIDLPFHSRKKHAMVARNLRRLMIGVPPLVDRFSGFDRAIRKFTDGQQYDLAVIEHFWAALYGQSLNARHKILNLHNVESVLLDRRARIESGPSRFALKRFARLSGRMETALLPEFDKVLVPSEEDARAVSGLCHAVVYPNAVPAAPLPDIPKRREIVFSGNLTYAPNESAVQWFRRETWPLLRARYPDLRWRLIGRNAEAYESWPFQDSRIEVAGPVEDAIFELASAEVAIAPLLAGSGTRLKIIEAWAAGLPVVSTTLGAEGLTGPAVLADSPADFAQAVSRLLDSESERRRVGAEGRAAYEERYSWPAVWNLLDKRGL